MRPTIAIVGAGFSGVATAVHLARLPWPGGIRIVLFERAARFARGVAYATDHPHHLLNVPAGRMGALADDEGHFLAWLRRREPALTGDAFVPRGRYGEYLEWLLDDAVESAAPGIDIVRRAGDVVDATLAATRVTLTLRDGDSIDADRVVLALGNLPPRDPFAGTRVDGHARYVPDPWAPSALAQLPVSARPILLVGTGLTMVDAVLALRDAGHRNGFVAVSRRGLLPLSHRDWPAKPPVVDPPAALDAWNGSTPALLRMIRTAARAADRSGLDWRDVVNGLRPITPELWRRMPQPERARFLRHVRPFWETHRHRMSTRVAEKINQLIARRELSIVAGRVADVTPGVESIVVDVRLRGRLARERYLSGGLVNCTGPESDFTRVREPLVAALRARRAIVPDTLGLGLVTDREGALLDADGRASPVLFTLGSPRKADAWESTAVPELRTQAGRLSARLRASLL